MDPKTVRALLDAQDWADVRARVLEFATYRCRDGKKIKPSAIARGKDLTQTAIVRVYANDSKWDPEKEPDLVRFLMSVVNSALYNERHSAYARHRSLSEPATEDAASYVPDARANTEAIVANLDLLSRRLALLEERLTGDPDALTFLALMQTDEDATVDVARHTRWSDDKIATVRRRVVRSAEIVARDLGGSTDDDPIAPVLDAHADQVMS